MGAHDAHPLAIAPIQLAALLLEMELLWRECRSLGNDRDAIISVQVHAFDGAIVPDGIAHVGPVDVASFGIHHDSIRDWACCSYDDLFVRAIGSFDLGVCVAIIFCFVCEFMFISM